MCGDNIWIIAAAILLMLLVMSAIQLVLIRRRRQLERQYKDLEQMSSTGEPWMRTGITGTYDMTLRNRSGSWRWWLREPV